MSDAAPIVAEVINADVLCLQCDYNLRSLHTDAACPECGLPVAESLRGDDLRYADRHWLKAMHWAALLEMAQVLAGVLYRHVVLLLFQNSWQSGNEGMRYLQAAISIGFACVAVIIAWLISGRDRRLRASADPYVLRWMARGGACVTLAGTVVFNGVFLAGITLSTQFNYFTSSLIYLGLFGIPAVIANTAELLLWRRVAKRASDRPLSRSLLILVYVQYVGLLGFMPGWGLLWVFQSIISSGVTVAFGVLAFACYRHIRRARQPAIAAAPTPGPTVSAAWRRNVTLGAACIKWAALAITAHMIGGSSASLGWRFDPACFEWLVYLAVALLAMIGLVMFTTTYHAPLEAVRRSATAARILGSISVVLLVVGVLNAFSLLEGHVDDMLTIGCIGLVTAFVSALMVHVHYLAQVFQRPTLSRWARVMVFVAPLAVGSAWAMEYVELNRVTEKFPGILAFPLATGAVFIMGMLLRELSQAAR